MHPQTTEQHPFDRYAENSYLKHLVEYMDTLIRNNAFLAHTKGKKGFVRKMMELVSNSPLPPEIKDGFRSFLLELEKNPSFKPENVLDINFRQKLVKLNYSLEDNTINCAHKVAHLQNYARALAKQCLASPKGLTPQDRLNADLLALASANPFGVRVENYFRKKFEQGSKNLPDSNAVVEEIKANWDNLLLQESDQAKKRLFELVISRAPESEKAILGDIMLYTKQQGKEDEQRLFVNTMQVITADSEDEKVTALQKKLKAFLASMQGSLNATGRLPEAGINMLFGLIRTFEAEINEVIKTLPEESEPESTDTSALVTTTPTAPAPAEEKINPVQQADQGLGLPAYEGGDIDYRRLIEEQRKEMQKCREVLKKHPDDHEAHLNLGIALFAVNEHEEALGYFKKSIELNPDKKSEEVRVSRGHIKTIEEYGFIGRAVPEVDPKSVTSPEDALKMANFCTRERKDPEGAKKWFSRAIELQSLKEIEDRQEQPVPAPAPAPPVTTAPTEPKTAEEKIASAESAETIEEWHVSSNGQQVGPISITEIQSRRDAGEVSGESLVWRAGMAEWTPIANNPETAHLFALEPEPAPQPALPPIPAIATGTPPATPVAPAPIPVPMPVPIPVTPPAPVSPAPTPKSITPEKIEIVCDNCNAIYQFLTTQIPDDGYDAECTACNSVFFVSPSSAKRISPTPISEAFIPGAPIEGGGMTRPKEEVDQAEQAPWNLPEDNWDDDCDWDDAELQSEDDMPDLFEEKRKKGFIGNMIVGLIGTLFPKK